MAEIQLRNRKREVVAVALLDDEDYGRVLALGPWYRNAAGYATHSIYLGGAPDNPKFARIQMARAVLGLGPGDPQWTDHRNGNRLDNHKANIRLTSPAQNNQNMPARTGRFRGVHWAKDRQKWRASVRLNGKLYNLGCFDTEEAAASVAAVWRAEHMPYSEPTR